MASQSSSTTNDVMIHHVTQMDAKFKVKLEDIVNNLVTKNREKNKQMAEGESPTVHGSAEDKYRNIYVKNLMDHQRQSSLDLETNESKRRQLAKFLLDTMHRSSNTSDEASSDSSTNTLPETTRVSLPVSPYLDGADIPTTFTTQGYKETLQANVSEVIKKTVGEVN